jgi:hypothetical protein
LGGGSPPHTTQNVGALTAIPIEPGFLIFDSNEIVVKSDKCVSWVRCMESVIQNNP